MPAENPELYKITVTEGTIRRFMELCGSIVQQYGIRVDYDEENWVAATFKLDDQRELEITRNYEQEYAWFDIMAQIEDEDSSTRYLVDPEGKCYVEKMILSKEEETQSPDYEEKMKRFEATWKQFQETGTFPEQATDNLLRIIAEEDEREEAERKAGYQDVTEGEMLDLIELIENIEPEKQFIKE